jgi:CRISPR-associated protein Cmr1
MKRLRVTLETVTPLFLGGADPQRGSPELRAASFRGVLRFWWRALWGGIHPNQPLTKLSKHESQVFGDTEQASSIIIRLSNPPQNTESWQFRQKPGVDYLFFSLQGRRNEPDRRGFSPGQQFKLTLQTRLGLDKDQEDKAFLQACAAFWLMVTFGSLGARSRRGAGNLRVVDVEGWPQELPSLKTTANSAEGFVLETQSKLKKLYEVLHKAFNWPLPENGKPQPPFDVLHPRYGQIFVYEKTWKTWQAALDQLGENYKKYRNKSPDRKQVGDVIRGRSEKPETVNRAAFGFPIVYYYRGYGFGGMLEGEDGQRRASPLIFHVTRLKNGEYLLSFVFFDAPLLPDGVKLKLNPRQGDAVFVDPPNKNPILDFLISIGKKGSELFIAKPEEIKYPKPEEKSS